MIEREGLEVQEEEEDEELLEDEEADAVDDDDTDDNSSEIFNDCRVEFPSSVSVDTSVVGETVALSVIVSLVGLEGAANIFVPSSILSFP